MNWRDNEIGQLRQALHSKDRHERAEAAIELGSRGDEDSLGLLCDMRNEPDDLVAVSAVYACWQLGDQSPSLRRVVANLAAEDEENVQLAVQVLCEMGESAVPKLVELLKADSPHASHVLRILGDIGGPASLAAVRRVARSENSELVEIAQDLLDDWEDD
jgi:HEAT repeat protein